ncbi:MAG: sigma-E processing peptidase SpoIIGA [Bacillota bacterium]
MNVVYLDQWLSLGLMRALYILSLLWVTGRISGERVIRIRMAAAFIIVFIYSISESYAYEVGNSLALSTWWAAFLALGLVFGICLPGIRRKFIFILYFMGFYALSTGFPLVINSFMTYYGRETLPVWQAVLWSLGTLLAVSEIGFGIIHQRDFIRDFYLLRIYFQNRQCTVQALLDNGNRLCEPFTRRPVIIVSRHKLQQVLPEPWFEWLKSEGGSPPSFRHNGDDYWLSRFSLIPYQTIDRERSFICSWRADYVEIQGKGALFKYDNPIIAAADSRFAGQSFEALLPPAILADAAFNKKKEGS